MISCFFDIFDALTISSREIRKNFIHKGLFGEDAFDFIFVLADDAFAE